MALPLNRDSDISSIQPPDLATFDFDLEAIDRATLEIYLPVMQFLEAEKEKLPVELREAMERDEEWDLTPTQFIELLEQLCLPQDMLDGVVRLMDVTERAKKWADDCEALHHEVCRAVADIDRARADGEEAAEPSQATHDDSDVAKENSEESHACQRL
ncbi:hypothetical protein C8Q74DRAFT_1367388 [Fomes fomentarius]|nr:hypothetical protein C8Q74DRAFT_1367388 [Fomes fomentarius]